jgi:hypothetical protein
MHDMPAIGTLNWVALATRPDIAVAVTTVARFAASPGPTHWEAVKRGAEQSCAPSPFVPRASCVRYLSHLLSHSNHILPTEPRGAPTVLVQMRVSLDTADTSLTPPQAILTHAQGLRTILALYTAESKDEDNGGRVNEADNSSSEDGTTIKMCTRRAHCHETDGHGTACG